MELSWESALRVMVSDGGSRVFLFIFLNAAVKYFAVAIIVSVAVAVVMMILRHFLLCELNWWYVSKFYGNGSAQYWVQCTIHRVYVDTMGRNIKGVHEEEL